MKVLTLATLLAILGSGVAPALEAEPNTQQDEERVERALEMHSLVEALREASRTSWDEEPGTRRMPTALHLRSSEARRVLSSQERALELTRQHLASRRADGDSNLLLPAIEARLATGRPHRHASLSFTDRVVLAARDEALTRNFTQSIDCCLCSGAGDCSDNVFCNGQEQCTQLSCRAGTPPSCADADPCTNDFCNTSTDACDTTPVPPPPEVAQVDVTKSILDPSVAELSWTSVSGSVTYNLYRGQGVDLFDLACFEPAIPLPMTQDDGTISATDVHVFLVTAKECGESGLGNDTSGPRTPPVAVCP